MTKYRLFICILLTIGAIVAVSNCNNSIDIKPYNPTPDAEVLYQKGLNIIYEYYNRDSTLKGISYIDKALEIDDMNPNYYGVKAKLLTEMGELEEALDVQTLGYEKGAINGQYLFQLGLLQSAMDMPNKAKKSFKKCKNNLKKVIKEYPDSLTAFLIFEAANSLYEQDDDLFMKDIDEIREKFPDRLMEIELTRRLKPHNLIRQIVELKEEKDSPTLDELGLQYLDTN